MKSENQLRTFWYNTELSNFIRSWRENQVSEVSEFVNTSVTVFLLYLQHSPWSFKRPTNFQSQFLSKDISLKIKTYQMMSMMHMCMFASAHLFLLFLIKSYPVAMCYLYYIYIYIYIYRERERERERERDLYYICIYIYKL
jgi:hypothetical protein